MKQAKYEENKGNHGIGATMFTYEKEKYKWNSSTTTDELIPRDKISQTIGEINPKLNIHKKEK